MLRIPWTTLKTNIEVIEEMGQTRSLVSRIREQQAAFLGYNYDEKGRFRTHYHYRRTGRKTRQGENKKAMFVILANKAWQITTQLLVHWAKSH